ncbi:MAG TPA: UPF0280 family protein [Candidatus Omnitrophota bacterium]|nr:UPF0280 family protein [Candidatus Omnitrophota bacterium]HNQ50061.1 UPF0280 family protein [Candidatus Omnitrophota bacterium]HQO37302.1 UPF0280 family protein [Candidatus Omnitrophota bacterium]HQQ05747.1 UPF0280 family protein [Candidatus Omnitrophota bacterium]
MNTVGYQRRFYRDWTAGSRLRRIRVCVEETDILIFSDRAVDRAYCIERISAYRGQIRTYIARDERFLTGLEPVVVERNAPPLIRDMAAAARKADVGPMAAVAGAIAGRLGRDLLARGCRDVIVENGGDIFMKARTSVVVGLFAGRSALSGRIRLRVDPGLMPCGMCTSSGTVGHSLSFGRADAAVIVAANAALADAVATAAGNRVRTAGDCSSAIGFARSVRGVKGILLVIGNTVASWGAITLAGPAARNNLRD